MVRPPKISDLTGSNFRRITKKSDIKASDLPDKYQNEAKKTTKPDLKKLRAPTSLPFKDSTEIFSSTPPSLRKSEPKEISIRTSKKGSQLDFSTNDLKHDRTFSGLKKQKTRSVLNKNKVPVVTKSEQMGGNLKKELAKKNKLKLKNTVSTPPAEKFFKVEGKHFNTQPNKSLVGRLITPKLDEEKCEKLEQELKNEILNNKNDLSEMSVMNQYILGPKTLPVFEKKNAKKIKKTKIPARKSKKPQVLKADLDKNFEIEKLSPKSEIINEELNTKGIKHNDSFVISARKLQSSAKASKRPKPEVIRLFKRKENAKQSLDTKKLKSCLKKNSEIRTKDSEEIFGEKLQIDKKISKRSQIPRLNRETTLAV